MGWALLGALLIGISLGLLGSGGSILTVPVLVFLLDEPEKVAIAESLGVVAAISLFGAIPYAIRKEVDWKSVVFFGVPGTLGTYAGAGFSEFLSGNTQFMIFGVVMILAAFMMLRNGPGFKKANPETGKAKWLLVIEGLIVGVITGLVGVGGGFLIIPALVLVAGLDMRIAVGTSLFIIAAKSSLGFYKYLDVLRNSDMQVNWQLLIVFTLIGILGSLVGGRLSRKIPQRALRRGFGVFLIIMGVYILGANFF